MTEENPVTDEMLRAFHEAECAQDVPGTELLRHAIHAAIKTGGFVNSADLMAMYERSEEERREAREQKKRQAAGDYT